MARSGRRHARGVGTLGASACSATGRRPATGRCEASPGVRDGAAVWGLRPRHEEGCPHTHIMTPLLARFKKKLRSLSVPKGPGGRRFDSGQQPGRRAGRRPRRFDSAQRPGRRYSRKLPTCSRYHATVEARPSSRPICACQPAAASRKISSSFCGVPSGLDASHSTCPSNPTPRGAAFPCPDSWRMPPLPPPPRRTGESTPATHATLSANSDPAAHTGSSAWPRSWLTRAGGGWPAPAEYRRSS